ncbi:MAG: transcription repressor NadR [Anaerovoracaceae bacterium]|jgi:transcriptional regulator of NAD metabolism|nr:transcription repressor NadR [Anaerovoracaceae bacterium]
MDGEKRRKEILESLGAGTIPLSGNYLAKLLDVSRQVIVQDIALLRVGGHKIFSTNKGYVLNEEKGCRMVFKVRHDDEEIHDELYTIVDLGGRVLDVFVNHQVYGELRADLFLVTREDIEWFEKKMALGEINPLKKLTGDIHYHTVEADSKDVLDKIKYELEKKGYLV